MYRDWNYKVQTSTKEQWLNAGYIPENKINSSFIDEVIKTIKGILPQNIVNNINFKRITIERLLWNIFDLNIITYAEYYHNKKQCSLLAIDKDINIFKHKKTLKEQELLKQRNIIRDITLLQAWNKEVDIKLAGLIYSYELLKGAY